MAADDDNDCNIDWKRPNQSFHAHFDCFSGAAGDMMFAACLDAAGDEKNKDRLLKYVSNCLSTGMPELAGEFEIEAKKVWRGGMGSIAGLHVNVKSRYHHAPAPVPERSSSSNEKEGSSHSTHGHAHAHDTQQLEPHSHDSTHNHDSATHTTKEGDSHDHSHSHGHSHNHSHQNDADAADSHDHDHGHSHKDNDTDHADHGHTHGHDIAANSHDHSHSHKDNDTNHDGSHHDHAHSHGHGHAHSHGHSHGHGDDDDDIRGPLRNLPEILKLLEQAPDKYIDPWVRTMASAAFTELAKAEAQTHGADSIESVHFHEVGAVDSIVDTVGTLIAMHCLGVVSVSCSRLPLGEGTVWTDHGLLPVPAPATLRLLVDMPVCQGPPGVTGELVTPTGAALLKALTKASNVSSGIAGRPPNFTIRKIGIGAGTKDFEKHPNVIRLLLGDSVLPPRAKVAT